MILQNKPTTLSINTPQTVTLNVAELSSSISETFDAYESNPTNWKVVEFIYKNDTQIKRLIFRLNKSLEDYSLTFNEYSLLGNFECVKIRIEDYQADSVVIKRDQFASLFGSAALFDIEAVDEPVDVTPPTILSYQAPNVGTYRVGDNFDYDFTFSEPVLVQGTPSITIYNVTDLANYLTVSYVSGSGTNVLKFRYTIQSTLTPKTDIAVRPLSPIQLNGGTIRDAAGNNSQLTFNSFVLGNFTFNDNAILQSAGNIIEYNNNVYFLTNDKPIIKLNTSTNTFSEIPGTLIQNHFSVEIFNNKLYFFNVIDSLPFFIYKLFSLDSSDNLTMVANIKGSTVTDVGRRKPFLRKTEQYLYTYLTSTVLNNSFTDNPSELYRIDMNNNLVRLGMFGGSGWIDDEIINVTPYNNSLHFIMNNSSNQPKLFNIIENEDPSSYPPVIVNLSNSSSGTLLLDIEKLTVSSNVLYTSSRNTSGIYGSGTPLIRYESLLDYDLVYDQNNNYVYVPSGNTGGIFSSGNSLFINGTVNNNPSIRIIDSLGSIATLPSSSPTPYPRNIEIASFSLFFDYPNNGTVTIGDDYYFFSRFYSLNNTRLVMYKLNLQTLTYTDILSTPFEDLASSYTLILHMFSANNKVYYILGRSGLPGIELYRVDSDNNHVRIV